MWKNRKRYVHLLLSYRLSSCAYLEPSQKSTMEKKRVESDSLLLFQSYYTFPGILTPRYATNHLTVLLSLLLLLSYVLSYLHNCLKHIIPEAQLELVKQLWWSTNYHFKCIYFSGSTLFHKFWLTSDYASEYNSFWLGSSKYLLW